MTTIESENDYIHEDLIVAIADLLRKKREEKTMSYDQEIDKLKEWVLRYLLEWDEDRRKNNNNNKT
jgi:hypothetical protein